MPGYGKIRKELKISVKKFLELPNKNIMLFLDGLLI